MSEKLDEPIELIQDDFDVGNVSTVTSAGPSCGRSGKVPLNNESSLPSKFSSVEGDLALLLHMVDKRFAHINKQVERIDNHLAAVVDFEEACLKRFEKACLRQSSPEGPPPTEVGQLSAKFDELKRIRESSNEESSSGARRVVLPKRRRLEDLVELATRR